MAAVWDIMVAALSAANTEEFKRIEPPCKKFFSALTGQLGIVPLLVAVLIWQFLFSAIYHFGPVQMGYAQAFYYSVRPPGAAPLPPIRFPRLCTLSPAASASGYGVSAGAPCDTAAACCLSPHSVRVDVLASTCWRQRAGVDVLASTCSRQRAACGRAGRLRAPAHALSRATRAQAQAGLSVGFGALNEEYVKGLYSNYGTCFNETYAGPSEKAVGANAPPDHRPGTPRASRAPAFLRAVMSTVSYTRLTGRVRR